MGALVGATLGKLEALSVGLDDSVIDGVIVGFIVVDTMVGSAVRCKVGRVLGL